MNGTPTHILPRQMRLLVRPATGGGQVSSLSHSAQDHHRERIQLNSGLDFPGRWDRLVLALTVRL